MLTPYRGRREWLAIELYQEGKTHQDVTQTVTMSQNTMKAVLNRADKIGNQINQDITNSSEGLVDSFDIAKIN